ncbi:hypothetical protein GALL_81430 [mine drainage metagenome]|uniref:Uncharacterized protein n=1 Tax=mine drainage metagenome TaxID=410659 RepID=A0A1J5SML4_9ZZZZ
MARKFIDELPATKTLLLRATPILSTTNIPKCAALISAMALLLIGGAGCSSAPGNAGARVWPAGNPNGTCRPGIPSDGQPVDTSIPTTVVGNGAPESCTYAKLNSAVERGGIITFDCGASPVTIPVTATLNIQIDRDTVVDGGRKVTLDGRNLVRIMSFDSPDFQANEHRLTLQHIALINGKTTPTAAIPVAPFPCSQGWNDGEGGAVYMQDGNLTVIDSVFTGNQGAPLGPDTGGGAIYVMASKHGALIVGSTFNKNAASNAGAVGALHADLRIYNSLFSQNTAVGNGANNNIPAKCSVINNNQNEIGSGGNGGAIYSDGTSVNVLLCGDKIVGNSAGVKAYGGGLFFTSNNMQGTLSIIDTEMTGNTGGYWTVVSTGTTRDAGTAVGTNCKTLSIRDSTLQGLP